MTERSQQILSLDKDMSSPETSARIEGLFRFAQVGRCVNGVTHDINNYLGAILAYAELVSMESGLSAEAQRMLKEIIGGVEKCSELISRLTDIARDEKPSSSMIDPAVLAGRALLLRNYALRTAQIKVETSVQEGLAPIIVDVPKLELAFIYLLANAQEALKEQPHKLIRFRIAGNEQETSFAIWNSGPSIPPESVEALFEPYRTGKDGGHLGLGLPTARRYAALHGGTLVYEAERGFVLTIPREA